jgi:tripartite ATP-independent transporter DctM subunit
MPIYCLLLITLLLLGLSSGYPVAIVLGGSAILTASVGLLTGHFDPIFFYVLPERLYGVMTNESLIAIPLFVLMGVILEKSDLAKELLKTMGDLTGGSKTSLSLSVFFVGALLAASTGIVGATVVTMGLISLPSLLEKNVSPARASGIVAASGTLGQIIPPSIVLIILGDVISTANQEAQLNQGVFKTSTVSVGDLFAGALIPGFILVGLYMVFVFLSSFKFNKKTAPEKTSLINKRPNFTKVLTALFPPIILILLVLGSILFGVSTPTEAASVGVVGAVFLSLLKNKLDFSTFKDCLNQTVITTSMVFLILIGANILSIVFRGFEGEELVHNLLSSLGTEPFWAFLVVMTVIFFLGFFLDFFEITFVVVPLVGPTLISMGYDPVWLGVMIALNLQTSFLTPPFGFSLFYLRGVAPESIRTYDIYVGVIPFIAIQILMLALLYIYPELALKLPNLIFGS